MRLKAAIAAAALAVSLAGTSQAADINEQGAKDLLANLTYFLPDDIVKSGFITVNAASDHYDVSYDLQKLFDAMKAAADVTISGLKPLTASATPQDSGLWNIAGSNAFDVTTRTKPGKGPDAEFRYAIASSTFNGVFDPALHYIRSMDAKGSGIILATKTTDKGVQKNDATIDGVSYTLSSADSGEAGRLDLQMNGNLNSFYDKISSDVATFAELKIGSIDFNAGATKLPLKALNEIFSFASAHKDSKTLPEKDAAEFKAILLSALPVVGSFEETVSARDLSVTTPFGDGGLQKMDYSLKVDGPPSATNFNVGMRLEKLNLTSGLIPQDYMAFIPDAVEFQIGVPDLNFSAMTSVFQKADVNKPDAELEKKLQKAMFPNGTVTITYPKVSAVSGLYDIEASGSMRGWLNEKDRVSMKLTVLARDFDKTIAAVQDAGKTEPDLAKVSFGLIMAKGFAKTDPDGRSRWDISIADDKTVTVNGQVIK